MAVKSVSVDLARAEGDKPLAVNATTSPEHDNRAGRRKHLAVSVSPSSRLGWSAEQKNSILMIAIADHTSTSQLTSRPGQSAVVPAHDCHGLWHRPCAVSFGNDSVDGNHYNSAGNFMVLPSAEGRRDIIPPGLLTESATSVCQVNQIVSSRRLRPPQRPDPECVNSMSRSATSHYHLLSRSRYGPVKYFQVVSRRTVEPVNVIGGLGGAFRLRGVVFDDGSCTSLERARRSVK